MVAQVIHRARISLPEAVAKVFPQVAGNMRMPERVMIFDVGMPMMVKIVAGRFYTIVKSLALRLAKLLRWSIPVTMIVILPYSRGRACCRHSVGAARIRQHH